MIADYIAYHGSHGLWMKVCQFREPNDIATVCVRPAVIRLKIHTNEGQKVRIPLCRRHAELFSDRLPDNTPGKPMLSVITAAGTLYTFTNDDLTDVSL